MDALRTASLGGLQQVCAERLQQAIGAIDVGNVTFVAVETGKLAAARSSFGAGPDRTNDQVVGDVLATYGWLAAPTPLPEIV